MKLGKTGIILISIASAGTLVGGFFLYRNYKRGKQKNELKDVANLDIAEEEIANVQVPNPSDFPLQLGSNNSKVRDVQLFINMGLKDRKLPTILVDGQWGGATNTAWKALGKSFDKIDERQYKIIKAFLMKRMAMAMAVGGVKR